MTATGETETPCLLRRYLGYMSSLAVTPFLNVVPYMEPNLYSHFVSPEKWLQSYFGDVLLLFSLILIRFYTITVGTLTYFLTISSPDVLQIKSLHRPFACLPSHPFVHGLNSFGHLSL